MILDTDVIIFSTTAFLSLLMLSAIYLAFRTYRKNKGIADNLPERDFQLPIDKQKLYFYGSFFNPDSSLPVRKRFIPLYISVIVLYALSLLCYFWGALLFAWLFNFLIFAVVIFVGIKFIKVLIDDQTALKIK
ncbi:MAG: hypothetical protein J0L60_12975 [Ignavibacteria bacterium]|nr:hypothetical protein [Ignavibacteria bacterium]